MSPPFDSVDVVLGSIMVRMDKSENDINELHVKQREVAMRVDQLHLYAEDFKGRMRIVESHQQSIFDSHSNVSAKVEMMEAKLDDLRSNLTKVIEGQMQIINSNAATREEFGAVLAKQGSQHLEKMKRLRHLIYIGGGALLILAQWWASRTGQQTLLDSVLQFVSGGTTP